MQKLSDEQVKQLGTVQTRQYEMLSTTVSMRSGEQTVQLLSVSQVRQPEFVSQETQLSPSVLGTKSPEHEVH